MLGIGTYAFMWSIGFAGAQPAKPMNALDLLGKARELDVRVVQYGPNLRLDSLSPADLSSLISQAEKWGITLEMGTQGIGRTHLQQQISLARKIGCRLLRTTPDGPDGIIPPAEVMEKNLKEILPILIESDVFLAIENARMPARALAHLVDSVRSPYVGVTLDTVNSLAIPEGTEQVVEDLAPFVKSVHVKDFVVERLWHRMGFSVHGRPAGKGQLNVPWLLERLAGISPAPNVILELWPREQKSLQDTIQLENAWVAESVCYLRRYIEN
jgi:sugar phosphate isomerase/epimerase